VPANIQMKAVKNTFSLARSVIKAFIDQCPGECFSVACMHGAGDASRTERGPDRAFPRLTSHVIALPDKNNAESTIGKLRFDHNCGQNIFFLDFTISEFQLWCIMNCDVYDNACGNINANTRVCSTIITLLSHLVNSANFPRTS
jgi:hypothetical protein